METENTEQYRTHLLQQKELLTNAVKQLKTEFIGIDDVIDHMADAMSSWLFFPEMQDRPVVINLWGLTGIGKTSLVKRFVELIGYVSRYFRFDLGENTKEYYDIQDSFKEIYENCDGKPFIIGMDEFQLARTINENKEEVERPNIRTIWDLLDNGKFDYVYFHRNLGWFGKFIKLLGVALEKGVEVENGVITANLELYKQIVNFHEEEEAYEDEDEDDEEDLPKIAQKRVYFIQDSQLNIIFNILDRMFISKDDLRKKFNQLDGMDTLEFLMNLYKTALRPKIIDCTKSLIFVMGNLDEVYSMTRNFNPDMSANEFHRQSKKITITQVKEALLTRFRSEQIARLGNNHIIYPTFDEKAFQGIIRLELQKIRNKVFEAYQLEMKFDSRIEQLIYDEGVYPTQGTRPLFTTIHQIVNSRLGKILNEIYLNGFLVDSLLLTVNDSQSQTGNAALQIDFIKDGELIHQLVDQQPLILGKLRKEKKNDEQAIVAVHESGHAILSSILMRTMPESVFSVTADSNSTGFVFARPKWNYISKKEVINRLAVLLGGIVAERVIFGEDNVTIGSGSDLKQATHLATQVIYACGMGDTLAAFGNQFLDSAVPFIFDHKDDGINSEAKELLVKAEELAEKTLEKQKNLLIQMADYLSDNRTINKDKIEEFIRKYAVDFDLSEIVQNADHLFYRSHLKRLAEELN